MKKINSLLLLLALVLSLSCSKESESAQDVAKNNLTRTWRAASATVAGLPVASVLQGTDLTKVKLNFKSDGTYTVEGINLTNINPAGTWKFDGSSTTDVILGPTNQKVVLSNLTSTTSTVTYSIPTAGTALAAFGANVNIIVNLVSP